MGHTVANDVANQILSRGAFITFQEFLLIEQICQRRQEEAHKNEADEAGWGLQRRAMWRMGSAADRVNIQKQTVPAPEQLAWAE